MDCILAAVDEDLLAEKVVAQAGRLAREVDAYLVVLHVMPEDRYRRIEARQALENVDQLFTISQAEEQARAIAAEAAVALRNDDVIRYETRGAVGTPAATIIALAEEIGADVIVVGFEGLRGLEKLRALGSTARAVLEQTNRPVLVVPAIVG